VTALVKPSEVAVGRVLDEEKVRRAKNGRPYIKPDPAVDDPKAKERTYTRMTTFIDVIDDKTNVRKWGERMVLVGVKRDPTIMERVPDTHPDHRAGKDALDELVERAKGTAGAFDKSDKGTHLHGLSEYVDKGLPLPEDTPPKDRRDMFGYYRTTGGMLHQHVERLVVLDDFQVAGTPDRLTVVPGYEGTFIADLKTGSVEYGALKMAAQLAGYSRGRFYDVATGERSPLPWDIRLDLGIIIHLPAGSGEATLYWVDLEVGWEAFLLASQVRELRRKGRKVLTEITDDSADVAEVAQPEVDNTVEGVLV
jgi:hypothetical protein